MVSKSSAHALDVLSYKYLSNPKDKHGLVNDMEHMSVLQLQRGVRTLNKIHHINWSKNCVLPNSVSFAPQNSFQLGMIYRAVYVIVNAVKSVWMLDKLSWNQCVQNMSFFYSRRVFFVRLQTATLQGMYVQRKIEARSCNHCCSGKTMDITQPECVFVALGIQHAMCIRYIVMWPSRFTIFFHIISWKVQFSKNICWTENVCFWVSLKILSQTFYFNFKKNGARYVQKCVLVFVQNNLYPEFINANICTFFKFKTVLV